MDEDKSTLRHMSETHYVGATDNSWFLREVPVSDEALEGATHQHVEQRKAKHSGGIYGKFGRKDELMITKSGRRRMDGNRMGQTTKRQEKSQ